MLMWMNWCVRVCFFLFFLLLSHSLVAFVRANGKQNRLMNHLHFFFCLHLSIPAWFFLGIFLFCKVRMHVNFMVILWWFRYSIRIKKNPTFRTEFPNFKLGQMSSNKVSRLICSLKFLKFFSHNFCCCCCISYSTLFISSAVISNCIHFTKANHFMESVEQK